MTKLIRMSKKEAAEKMGVSEKTIARYIKDGRLESAYSPGKSKLVFVMVPEDQIKGYTIDTEVIDETPKRQPTAAEEETGDKTETYNQLWSLAESGGITLLQSQDLSDMVSNLRRAKREDSRKLEEEWIKVNQKQKELEISVTELETRITEIDKLQKQREESWENDHQVFEDEKKELSVMLKKVNLAARWCRETLDFLFHSPTYDKAFKSEDGMPAWPEGIDPEEVLQWNGPKRKKRSKKLEDDQNLFEKESVISGGKR